MSSIRQFKIFGEIFTIQSQDLAATSFIIQSVPRPYPVKFISNESPLETIQNLNGSHAKAVFLIDQNVYDIYFKNANLPTDRVFKIPATEDFKAIDGMLKIVDFLNFNSMTKADRVVVVGGGITQDVSGFATSLFKRGIPWTFVPTTLLAQCDSCIGGKTGLNYKDAKNQLALFAAPYEVILNPEFLRSLSLDDLYSGLGEVLKLHLIAGGEILDIYEMKISECLTLKFNADALLQLLKTSLLIKRSVIEKDEFEINLRRSLNFGHTIGHAIESMSEFQIPHGSAVALGMVYVNELSSDFGFLSKEELDRANRLLKQVIQPKSTQVLAKMNLSSILSFLKKDKKTMGTKANFILLRELGNSILHAVELDADLESRIAAISMKIA